MQCALRERRERPHLLDLVAPELDAQRLATRRREDVDEPTADGELAALVGALDTFVARERERLGELLEADSSAGRDPDRLGPRSSSAASAPRGPHADAQTSPPRASTSSARARSPTRCGAGSSPEPQWTPRLGSSATRSSPRNQAGRLGGVAGVLILGRAAERADGRAPRGAREQQRQRRLGDAGARRERLGKALQAFGRAELLDERVEDLAGP